MQLGERRCGAIGGEESDEEVLALGNYPVVRARLEQVALDRLAAGAADGEFREGLGELEAWALMGMNVFVGLRYVVWGGAEMGPEEVAAGVNRLLAEGVMKR